MHNGLGAVVVALIVAMVATSPVLAAGQFADQAQADKGQAVDQAQIDKGRQVVAQVCTTCHTTLGRMLQVHKQTPEQWKDLVYFMISRGAQVMPNEIDAVAAYLNATAGKERGK